MSYLLWSSRREPGHCALSPTLIEEVKKLHLGEAVPPDFGQPIEYPMSDLFPDDIVLSDNYVCADQIIISHKLRQMLERTLHGHRLQFLPVTIRNHKGRVASSDHFLLHSQDVCDCIDVKRSKVQWNPLNKKRIMFCESLVIQPSAIPSDLLLFRLRHWGAKVLASKELSDALLGQKFVGLRFSDPAKYTGIG